MDLDVSLLLSALACGLATLIILALLHFGTSFPSWVDMIFVTTITTIVAYIALQIYASLWWIPMAQKLSKYIPTPGLAGTASAALKAGSALKLF